MTDESTLSAFSEAGTDGETDEKTDPRSDAGDTTEPDEAAPDSTESEFDSSLSTYAWGEYACRRCGEDADRVWRDDGEFVCPDCKEW
ncbi:hypothetical protein ACLI4Z_07410 [Natrialbaceae archaeon A-arb3/5]